MGNLMSASFAPECNKAKAKYDECFNEWYSEKFLKGKGVYNECEDLWEEYKECLGKALTTRGIHNMLDKSREDAPFEVGGRTKEELEELQAQEVSGSSGTVNK
ncbi:hypothetical protein V1520DRAFT_347644 [Lipomyces starkeyi]|uniref:Mitochondrial distribution and morphology protein 35 n=1 Tax=Lipomyces starkeyi NRRL Y-11557 TaxID=675824 RepID=A0A1E3QGG8_LIPST|nr:hypothetical protein LIPSTDRAFT_90249 [Lipomyces starkeyi NRRL Y-11557]